MEHYKPSGMCGVEEIMSEDRRQAIIGILTELKKPTLKQYLKSYGLPVGGTKLQLAMRIYDMTKKFTLQIHLPPSGVVSIGIALDPQE